MNDQPPPRRRRFQFRLRTIFLLTAAAAIVLAGLSAPSDRVRLLSAALLILALPVVLTTVLVYGRGYARTFCIGGLFPAGWSFLDALCSPSPTTNVSDLLNILLVTQPQSYLWDKASELVGSLLLDLVLTIATGVLAMGVRWLVESSNRADTQ